MGFFFLSPPGGGALWKMSRNLIHFAFIIALSLIQNLYSTPSNIGGMGELAPSNAWKYTSNSVQSFAPSDYNPSTAFWEKQICFRTIVKGWFGQIPWTCTTAIFQNQEPRDMHNMSRITPITKDTRGLGPYRQARGLITQMKFKSFVWFPTERDAWEFSLSCNVYCLFLILGGTVQARLLMVSLDVLMISSD